MEKQKRWQKYLILGVVLLTIYNILPTVFFYTKPLKSPIEANRAGHVSSAIIDRVNGLEKEAQDWIYSFSKLLKIKPQAVVFQPNDPQVIAVTFKDNADADKFRQYLPRAGTLIPFVPQQLSLYEGEMGSKVVMVHRQIPMHFDTNARDQYFQFSQKFEASGQPTSLYRALVYDRALQLSLAVGGVSENAQLMQAAANGTGDFESQQLVLKVAQNILSFVNTFGENSSYAKRYFASYTQIDQGRDALVAGYSHALEQTKDQIKLERIALQSESQSLQASGSFLDTPKQQRLELLLSQEKTLTSAEAVIKRQTAALNAGGTPFTFATVGTLLEESAQKAAQGSSKEQLITLDGHNPFIQSLTINWADETLVLNLYPDVIALQKLLEKSGKISLREQVDQLIYNEIAYESRLASERISPIGAGFQVKLSNLQGSKGFLAMRLATVAAARAQELQKALKTYWLPKHADLARSSFPIWDYETYAALPASEKSFGLVIYAPAMSKQTPQSGFRMNSIYVIAKGLDKIVQKLNADPTSQEAQRFTRDFNALKEIMQKNGLFGYPGQLLTYGREYAGDFIFEGEDYFQTVLKATREDFSVHGTKRYAVLEFSDVEQRILTENKIADKMHEDLLKWRDDYYAAQLSLSGASPYDVPKPTKSPLFDNLKLSAVKYFRGDDRKILHWGLDLSGGKTVQIELRDHNNRLVTNEEDIRQGINELYSRVNKMGVSEVSIRREGNFITLDFPGSQNLSANELIKASTMYFHIVNEKFNSKNAALATSTQQFLQNVWNEAVVTGRKSAEEINAIAWKHLHGDSIDAEIVQPRSEAARILHENGLKLANPFESSASSLFNDVTSKIAVIRGENFTEWYGQTHPLMIVYNNFAMEGASLKNVQAGYDPSKGNYLVFEIKGKETLGSGEKISPREDLYAWSSQFSKDKIVGTQYASYSHNDGWRMAVILNGSIITAPALSYAIRDGGTIEGSFTQREVSQLEADLKAGSLSFTPRILSEKNVSPELGTHERMLGILAMIISVMLAIATMVCYYRFGGIVASIAVIVNLLIMWATLQNLGATLTLASIAGIILALGMAVDANVLVFERIREEFAHHGRIATAVHAGYRKAFSAIFDSNITILIAAVILLQFDSGPIKGLAITLMIGILSSMFTALFMTRFFFAGWVQNPSHKELKMAQLIKSEKFDFLKYAKPAFISTAVIIAVGIGCFAMKRHSIMGMDFTGGYSLSLEVAPRAEGDYRAAIEKALIQAGASAQEIQVRQLTPETQIRIFLGKSMLQPGRPFNGMPVQYDLKDYTYAYETNPRISWVISSLNAAGIQTTVDSLKVLDQNWTEVSGQLSDSMRNSALIGLALALLCILIYITIRFEFKYAISATLCLAHDLALTLASIALLHFLRVPLQIDLNTVAALLTIVGYSLNDTIIIFDRIREDLRLMRKATFKEVVNHALNVTLSRTMLTSGTTMLVLLPLVFLGGSTIFGFALVMFIGVLFGTLSSLFIAAPLLYYFHQRALAKEGAHMQALG